MNEAGKNIIEQLFGGENIAGVSRRNIEQLTAKYPYYAPAQFLLAKKLKESHSNGSEEQLQKTALYFTNPYWLNFLLKDEIISEETDDMVMEDSADTIEEISEGIATIQEERVIPQESIENNDINKEPAIHEQETFIIVNHEQQVTTATIEESISETKAQENIEEDDLPPLDDATAESQRMKLSNLIEQHLSEFKKPLNEGDELPLKQSPFHTIDYFESQGIRAYGQDKFSSRVRKFTEWLREMKGANPQLHDLGTDTETERMIETIAHTSNETKDIVTEAMAEVLVKQGKTEKARQLYKKLSFLNPAKSTYFAAKIEELNNK